MQSIDYTRTRLATDAKSGGRRQFNGIVDCYVKTYRADGVRGLYRGFFVSCTCIFIYRGLYFGLFDSLKPILLGERHWHGVVHIVPINRKTDLFNDLQRVPLK